MAEAPVEQDIHISGIEEELRWLTDLQFSSSSESDVISEDEDSQRQLQEFAELSQKLLEEFTVLEAECEMELTREDQAEEHEIQAHKENKKPNSIDTQTAASIQCEQVEDVQSVVTDDQHVAEVDTDSSNVDQQIIEDLKKNIQKLSEEKEQIASELQELRLEAKRLNKELEVERLEKEAISMKLEKSQNKFLKLNRVSLAVTQEYAETLDQLEMEQNLRYEAESYASKVHKEKKAISRQSMILMQNVQSNEMLMKALHDVGSLTTTLEDTKQELQRKMKSLELQLSERPTEEELLTITENLNVLNMEKSQVEEELKVMKEKCTLLEERVKSLEEELQKRGTSTNSVDDASLVAPPVSPLPPPPPPPAPPCSLFKTPEDPLALIKQRRGKKESEGSPVTGGPDARADAVREMMERIKSGVILRPANDRKNQAAMTSKRKSVISELQGILLHTVRKPARRASRHRMSRKAKDSELESLLQRRRRIVDTPQKTEGAPKTEKNSGSLRKNDFLPPLVRTLQYETKLSPETQIKKTFDKQNRQKKEPERGQVISQ